MRVEWKCSTRASGGRFVTITGTAPTLRLSVGSSATPYLSTASIVYTSAVARAPFYSNGFPVTVTRPASTNAITVAGLRPSSAATAMTSVYYVSQVGKRVFISNPRRLDYRTSALSSELFSPLDGGGPR